MNRKFLTIMIFLAGASFAAAQTTGIMGTDVLGAHLNAGRGCAGCHAPHSGAQGQGITTADNTTGNLALWGEDVSVLSGKTFAFGATKYTELMPAISAGTPDVSGILMCLSCHDGNYAKGAMMKGTVYETLPSSYTSQNVPTFLGTDGALNAGTSNYLNDHPVGTNATFGCNTPPTGQTYGGESGYNWDCAVNVTGSSVKVTPGPNMAQFINNYGFFVSLAANGSTAYVMCTTCHNQHVMNVINVGASSTAAAGTAYGSGVTGMAAGQYATMFFLRGPYNPRNPASNSAAQFCRQCHGGESNEMNGIPNVPTVN
jgi:cytochrome c553